jgi:hypothetical protein
MPKLVAFWNATKASNWSDKTFQKRLQSLKIATFTASVEAHQKSVPEGAGTVGIIFVAPEYTFANADAGNKKPAEHVSVNDEGIYVATLRSISQTRTNMFLMPGTIAVKTLADAARNTCHAYHNDNAVLNFSKCQPVGEVANDDGLTFQPGVGYGSVVADNESFGAEICKDATGDGTLPNNVRYHLVTGQGVGHDAIFNRATGYQIVADFSSFGVYDYTSNRGGQKVSSYKNEEADGARLYYYLIT